MKAKQVGLSRLLPKTEQVTAYRPNDDGYYQAGWWRGRKVSDNKQRFIAKTLNGDDVVVDLATGLMWAADGDEAGCNNGAVISWNNALNYTNNLDFAGFTDWRMPNINELFSLVKFNVFLPSINTLVFPHTATAHYWSSTTKAAVTTFSWVVIFADGVATIALQVSSFYLRCVRSGL